jgi:hypothetical protein
MESDDHDTDANYLGSLQDRLDAEFHGALRDGLSSDLAQGILALGRLDEATGWPAEILCDRIGCNPDLTPARSEADKEARAQRLRHSRRYLEWLVRLVRDVPAARQQDYRQIVVGARRLSRGAGGDIETRIERCDRALRFPVGNGLSAAEFLKLGETTRAWHTASLALGHGAAYDKAIRVESITGLAATPSHIHPRRLKQLVATETGPELRPAQTLGAGVAAYMAEHIEGCRSCEAALDGLQPVRAEIAARALQSYAPAA